MTLSNGDLKSSELNRAKAANALLQTALHIACGELSTYRNNGNDHPEVVLNQILHEAKDHLMGGDD